MARLSAVTVGKQTQKQVEVVVLTQTGVLDSLAVSGILGQNFLNAYQQYWHFGATPWLQLNPISHK